MRPGKRGGFNLTFPYTFKILNFIFVMVRGRGGGTEKIILFMFYEGGGNEDFVDIWGGGSRIGLVLGVIFMQFWALS